MNQKRIYSNFPVAKEGFPFIIAGIILTCLFFFIGLNIAGLLFTALTLFVVYFFRDPKRVHYPEGNVVLSPADGTIISVDRLSRGSNQFEGEAVKVSIFMSIFNAHINRIPLKGKISEVSYHPGKFFSAYRDKASLFNEKNTVTLETCNKKRVVFVQIAGLIARRIVWWIKKGDQVQAGQRFGLIKFGSRVDIYLPPECRVTTKKGLKVKAGETVIGYLDYHEKEI